MSRTVKAIAKLTGVSVRTLHYYDEIGLLTPSGRSGAGYRLYSEADLHRLQMILFYRELGFDLQSISQVLADPKFDRKAALLQHRRKLIENQSRLKRLIQTVDHTLQTIERKGPMTTELFDGFDPAKHAPEAESDEICRELASLINEDPASPEVQRWIGRHHQQINDRIYTCSATVYRGLADLYTEDPNFRATYDSIKPGLADFLSAGMRVYANAMTKS